MDLIFTEFISQQADHNHNQGPASEHTLAAQQLQNSCNLKWASNTQAYTINCYLSCSPPLVPLAQLRCSELKSGHSLPEVNEPIWVGYLWYFPNTNGVHGVLQGENESLS